MLRSCKVHGLTEYVKSGPKNRCRRCEVDRKAKLRQEKRDWLAAHKDQPCVDCGLNWPPYVMDFHHRDPSTKRMSVSRAMVTLSRQDVLEEIAKCDLLCANCHRIREYQQEEGVPGSPLALEARHSREFESHLPDAGGVSSNLTVTAVRGRS